jgi:hypothetical protein
MAISVIYSVHEGKGSDEIHVHQEPDNSGCKQGFQECFASSLGRLWLLGVQFLAALLFDFIQSKSVRQHVKYANRKKTHGVPACGESWHTDSYGRALLC